MERVRSDRLSVRSLALPLRSDEDGVRGHGSLVQRDGVRVPCLRH